MSKNTAIAVGSTQHASLPRINLKDLVGRTQNNVSQKLEHKKRWRYYFPYITIIPAILIIGWAALKTLFKGLTTKPKRGSRWNFFHFALTAKELPYIGILSDRKSPYLKMIRQGSMGYKALDYIYNYEKKRQELQGWERLLCDYWVNMLNAQAVRNRYRLVRQFIVEAMRDSAEETGKNRFTLLSIAAGAAQAAIEAAVDLREEGIFLHCILTDLDEDALKDAERVARENGVMDRIETHVLPISRAVRQFGEQADVVDLVGFLDYQSDSRVIRYLQLIHKIVRSGTYFMTGHIHQNIEMMWLWFVLCWPMKYRSRGKFERLVQQSSWTYELCTEPHGIHSIVFARK